MLTVESPTGPTHDQFVKKLKLKIKEKYLLSIHSVLLYYKGIVGSQNNE